MRVYDEDSFSVCSELDHAHVSPEPHTSAIIRKIPNGDNDPDPYTELALLVEELKEFALIRNTLTGVKRIAARLEEILPDLKNAEDRAHSSPNTSTNIADGRQKIIRQRETIMAELLQISGAQDQTTAGSTTDDKVRTLITWQITGTWWEQ